jgi:DNA-binding IclR family transcriptional regulator
MVGVGEVKPFTSSYSGLALLASSPPDVISRALDAHLTDAPDGWWDQQQSETQMRAQLASVTNRGYCGGPGLVMPGVSGLAAPVHRSAGQPVLAISISAIDARLDDTRISQLAPRLLQAARQISLLTSP